MKRRTVMILVGVLVVGALGTSLAAVFRPFEGGPRYKGMPVSYWQQDLREYLESEITGGRPSSLVARLKYHLGFRNRHGVPAVVGNDPKATPLLLELMKCRDMREVRGHAYYALRAIDADALRSGLTNLFESSNKEERTFAARGTILVARANPESQAWSDLSRKMAVPVLIESLKDKTDRDRVSSALYLGVAGHNARSAVPALLVALADSEDAIRREAATALVNIDPEAAEKAGIK